MIVVVVFVVVFVVVVFVVFVTTILDWLMSGKFVEWNEEIPVVMEIPIATNRKFPSSWNFP